jgi:hypothetical protein
VEVDPPTITLSQEDGYVFQDTSLEKGSIFKIKVTATPGTYDLYTLGINLNNEKLSLDSIEAGINGNPSLLLGDDVTGFTKEIEIRTQNEANSKYTVVIEDTEGYTDGVDFFITEVFTSFDTIASDLKVYNFSGPLNGSIDLQVPEVVSSSDPDGDIQDVGIDINLPLETNWLQRIRPKNDCQLFQPAEGLTFDAVTSKEELKAAVEAGTERIESNTLSEGDIYLAKTPSLEGNTSDYFLLRVDEIFVEKTNNQDYYVFTLKSALNL